MIASLFGAALIIFAFVNSVVALPATKRGDVLPILTEQAVSTFVDFSHLASVAYCGPDLTASWTCGDNCDALPGFHVTGSGGDGGAIQYWFTAYSEESKNVVVAHQGTDPLELLSVLTDLKLFLGKPNATLYPGLSEDAMMHTGFLSAQESTADVIYESVMRTMAKYNTTSVTFVGHSLGAALSLLDALSLSLRLPKGTTIKVVNYGMPRVGNQAFADEVDRLIPDLTRITNQKDPIPIVPGRRLGYVHPHGEVHIDSDHNWIKCPGQDSEDERCTVANVSLMPFGWDIFDHIGWYDEIAIQCWNIGIKARELASAGSSR